MFGSLDVFLKLFFGFMPLIFIRVLGGIPAKYIFGKRLVVEMMRQNKERGAVAFRGN